MSKITARIKDVRGRSVTQLDPVAMLLLRQHDVMDADALRAIVREKGLAISRWERGSLIVGVLVAMAVLVIFTTEFLTGGVRDARYAKSVSFLYMLSLPWIMWFGIKRKRFSHVTAAMLKYARCPHCGYDLRKLPGDPADGATVCPECGCAWKLSTVSTG